MRIVLVEDNEMLARGVQKALEADAHCVEWFADGAEGCAHLTTEQADIAIVDINLPGMNGLDIVRQVRSHGFSFPVLMLTARGETEERVNGLDAGADDYLIKPFEMAELEARLRALARRQQTYRQTVEKLSKLTFDRNTRQVGGPEGALELSRRELALFECLFDKCGQIVSGSSIADYVYGVGSDTDANAVQLLVSRLRKRLEGTGVNIRTARGLGYMLDQDNV
ncbi:MAG: response regulator transcription factor [Hyphomicrobiales bacterium]